MFWEGTNTGLDWNTEMDYWTDIFLFSHILVSFTGLEGNLTHH